MKKLPVRLENAITKLYNAFHNNELGRESCARCAVGNIIGHRAWYGGSAHAYVENNLECVESIFLRSSHENNSGYSLEELAIVEYKFIVSIGKTETKETQFKGLCAVIEYLCELDGVDNVMEIQSLFEYKEGVKELNEIIQ